MAQKLTPEQAAFLEGLVHQYSKMLERYCARFFSYNSNYLPLVPDILQEVYLRATKDIEKVMASPSPAAWLKVCCKNTMLYMLRKLKTSREVLAADAERLLDTSPQKITAAIEKWQQDITIDDVREAVLIILSEEDQAIFEDYFLNDLTTKETAKLHNMSEDKVRGKISRMRKKLKKYFTEACQFLFFVFYILW